MKNISIYILLIILSSIVGFEIGNRGFFISKPSGEWNKILESKEYPFNSDDVYHLHILSIMTDPATRHLIINFYQPYSNGGGKAYTCDVDEAVCSPVVDLIIPPDISIHTFTHDVKLSEVPAIPLFSKNAELYIGRQFVDMVRIESLGGEYTLEEYYALLFDGSIWKWSYYSTITTDIEGFLFAIAGGVGGFVLSLVFVIWNARWLEKQAMLGEI